MASQNNFLGVTSFELGAPGDGIMGTTLTDFKDVEVGSVNLEGATQENETISTESNDSYLTVNSTPSPATVAARLYGVTADQMIILAGGTKNVASGLWEAPKTAADIYLSFQMKGKAIGTKRGVLLMPYAKVSARIQGTVTKNGLPAVDLLLTANTPVSEAGVEGAPYSYGVEDVT